MVDFDQLSQSNYYNLDSLYKDMILKEMASEPKTESLAQKIDEVLEEKIVKQDQKLLKEFENRWAKDVTFVVNGEKCAGDRHYLSAISPVFKKMLQDHAQDEITLEGVESADVLKDFFLAISSFCVQPNLTNVVPLIKLAHDYDIPFLIRSCEEYLKQCSEIPIVDRFRLVTQYDLSGLKLLAAKTLSSDDLINKLGELNILEQKREVLERLSNHRLAEILKDKKDALSEKGAKFLLENIAERLETENSVINNGLAKMLKDKKEMLSDSEINGFLVSIIADRLEAENRVTNQDLAKILKEKKKMLKEPGNEFLFDVIAERLEKDGLEIDSLRDEITNLSDSLAAIRL